MQHIQINIFKRRMFRCALLLRMAVSLKDGGMIFTGRHRYSLDSLWESVAV